MLVLMSRCRNLAAAKQCEIQMDRNIQLNMAVSSSAPRSPKGPSIISSPNLSKSRLAGETVAQIHQAQIQQVRSIVPTSEINSV